MTFIPETVVPPLTPFRPDLSVDYAALKRGVDYVVEDCDASIVIAAGVEAQEYQFLTLEERKELIRHTIDFVGNRRPVTVGVSHPSMRVAIELAQFAALQGAQSVQLLAPQRPFGGAPTTKDLLRYFEGIGKEISLPIMLYLNAGPGADVSVKDTVELARLDCIKYVKESSRDLSRVSLLISQIDDKGLARYYTTMQMLFVSLCLGGSGVTLPPPAAKLGSMIIKAFTAGNWPEAVRLQKQFSEFPARWMPYGLAPVMKAALTCLGIPTGQPYAPYGGVEGEDLEALKRFILSTDLAPQKTAQKENVAS